MKKLFFLSFLFILVNAFCFSQIRISAKTGLLGSDTNEILWNKNVEDAQVTSLLDWKTQAAPVISIDTQFNFSKIFFGGLKGFYTIPFSYGTIEDFDFANIFSTGTTERTHYSKHENHLDNYYNAEIFAGVQKTFSEKIKVEADLSIGFSYFSFTAQNGYKQYGQKTGTIEGNAIYSPWSNDIAKTPMTGDIITFESLNIFAGLGAGVSYLASEKISVKLAARLLPSIKSNAKDTHYKREYKYSLFEFPWHLAFDSSLLLEYQLNKRNALTADFNCLYASVKNGGLYQSTDNKDWIKATNPCGIKEFTWRILLGYTYIYEK